MTVRTMRPWASARAGLRLSIKSPQTRAFTSHPAMQSNASKAQDPVLNIEDLLSTPSWSVASLLPSKTASTQDSGEKSAQTPQISSKQLHHLLRLSALPPPTDAAEEAKMLHTLSSQLHFVREIQGIDTKNVSPLKSLRDETAIGEEAAELGFDALKEALGREEIRGKFHRRIRRKRDEHATAADSMGGEEWDVMGAAGEKVGRHFVVRTK